ncbi:hypothetical protein IGM_04356 [Bacillus cereus HuB4-4]|uniref:Uncharacterized protein n=1 Tax=Bacillus cereus HuB4-4 TaxID=1053211 RepID=A0A9W5QS66_BACCE|nr:hypothetical protein IGM_04356 [Bacillus cereus HuB4-4]
MRESEFKMLIDRLEDEWEQPDAIALKIDNKPWVVCMTLDKFLGGVKQD